MIYTIHKNLSVLGALTGRALQTITCMALLVSFLLTSCSPDESVQPNVAKQASLNVLEAAPGDYVTISGIDVSSDEDIHVLFSGTEATIVSKSASQIVVEVPQGAESGEVVVSTLTESYTIEDFFQIIINRIRPTYWVELDGADNKIVRGIADLFGNTSKTVLYSSENTIASISLEPLTNYLYWVEQEFDLTTFSISSTIYRGPAHQLSASSIDVVVADRAVITSLVVDLFSNKLYWTELPEGATTGSLYQATVHGQGISALYTSSLINNPSALKYDAVDEKLYFVSNGRNVIKAAADSSGIATLYAGPSAPRRVGGIAIDNASNRLFVSDLGLPGDETDLIRVGSLDGTTPLTTFLAASAGVNNPVLNTSALDVDRIGNYLYWLNSGTPGDTEGSIYRLKLDSASVPQRIFDGITIATGVDVRGRKNTAEVRLSGSIQ